MLSLHFFYLRVFQICSRKQTWVAKLRFNNMILAVGRAWSEQTELMGHQEMDPVTRIRQVSVKLGIWG